MLLQMGFPDYSQQHVRNWPKPIAALSGTPVFLTVANNQDQSNHCLAYFRGFHALIDFYRVTGRTTWVLFYRYSNIQEYSILGLSLVVQDQITHFPPTCNRNYGIFIFVRKLPFAR